MVRGIVITAGGHWLDFDYERHTLAEVVGMAPSASQPSTSVDPR